MTRDQVRIGLDLAGIKCSTVTEPELKKLRRLISKHLRRSGIYKGTARLVRAKKDLKFIAMKTEQWDSREAVSFNSDGFIGIAGWADNKNVKPIIDALIEWTLLEGGAGSFFLAE